METGQHLTLKAHSLSQTIKNRDSFLSSSVTYVKVFQQFYSNFFQLHESLWCLISVKGLQI